MLDLTTSKAKIAITIDGAELSVEADYSDENLSKSVRTIEEARAELGAIRQRSEDAGVETADDIADALAQVRRLPDVILGTDATDELVSRLGGSALSQMTKVFAYIAAEVARRSEDVRKKRIDYYLND